MTSAGVKMSGLVCAKGSLGDILAAGIGAAIAEAAAGLFAALVAAGEAAGAGVGLAEAGFVEVDFVEADTAEAGLEVAGALCCAAPLLLLTDAAFLFPALLFVVC